MNGIIKSKSPNVKRQPLIRLTSDKVISRDWNFTLLQSHIVQLLLTPYQCVEQSACSDSLEGFTKRRMSVAKQD